MFNQQMPGHPRERVPARLKHQDVPLTIQDEPEKALLFGFEAMGYPIPEFRKTAALAHIRAMVPDCTSDWAMECIAAVGGKLERDEPYEAMASGMKYLDITGVYRLMAVLLADPAPTCSGPIPDPEKEIP